MKSFVLTAGMAALFVTSVHAGGGNSGAAKGMAADVSSDRGVTASAAPSVSGKNATGPGASGWGNTGSAAISGDQVSDYGNKPN